MNPQDLYHAVQSGCNPHQFLMYMHRVNTGGLLLEDIRYEEEKKRKEQYEYTRKINLYNQKTVLMPIVVDPIEKAPPLMYQDEYGRMCLKLVDVHAHTADLAEEAVELFHNNTGAYPVDIVLSPFREIRINHYYHKSGIRIPYRYEIGAELDYDVLCRGLGGGVSWVL